jgi:hypothetical protein
MVGRVAKSLCRLGRDCILCSGASSLPRRRVASSYRRRGKLIDERTTMYRIEAVVPANRLDSLNAALLEQSCEGVHFAKLQCQRHPPEKKASYSGVAYDVPPSGLIALSLTVPDAELMRIVDCIAEAGATDESRRITISTFSVADSVESHHRRRRALPSARDAAR